MGQKQSKNRSQSLVPANPQEVTFQNQEELVAYLQHNEIILKNIVNGTTKFPDVLNTHPSFEPLRRALAGKSLPTSQSKPSVRAPKGTLPAGDVKFELYIAHSESGQAEANLVRANFEKRIRSSMLNQASSYDSVEEEVSSSGCIIFILTEGALQNEKCLFTLRCGTAYDKKIIVLHIKDSCPFPKFEDQPQEFRDSVMMEDVLGFTPAKQTIVFKEIDDKLQLPERKLDRGGLLTIQVVKAENLAVGDLKDVKKVYCIIEFDQNGVILDSKKDSDHANPEWKSRAKFDVSRPSLEFTITLWCTFGSGPDKFMGMCKPTVKFDTKTHQEVLELQSISSDQKITGNITIKTTYKKPEEKKKMRIEDFDLLKLIGKGSFGKVMQVKKKDTERIYAMKIIRKAEVVERNEIEHIIAERQVLAQMHHPFIVNLKFSFQSEDKLYLVLSFINGGELFLHLQESGKFDEYRAKFYTAELLLALEYLHSYNIIYRDVKPENILLDYSGHIALCDFGLCKMHMTKGEKTNTFCGTPEYLAPELLVGDGYTNVVDWWTLGILLYEMLTGLPPYYSEELNEMYRRIVEEDLTFPKHVSPEAQDLLSKLLEKDASKRLGVNGAQDIKNHPFFHDIDWARLMSKRITPPFKPKVVSVTDTSNFDKELTTQLPTDSLVEGSKLSESIQNRFQGFTYVNENKMTFANTPVFGKTLGAN